MSAALDLSVFLFVQQPATVHYYTGKHLCGVDQLERGMILPLKIPHCNNIVPECPGSEAKRTRLKQRQQQQKQWKGYLKRLPSATASGRQTVSAAKGVQNTEQESSAASRAAEEQVMAQVFALSPLPLPLPLLPRSTSLCVCVCVCVCECDIFPGAAKPEKATQARAVQWPATGGALCVSHQAPHMLPSADGRIVLLPHAQEREPPA